MSTFQLIYTIVSMVAIVALLAHFIQAKRRAEVAINALKLAYKVPSEAQKIVWHTLEELGETACEMTP